MDLYQKTFKLIGDRPARISLKDIADETNLKYSWLCKFAAGDITNPTFKNLQALHDYLISVGKRSA